LIPQIPEEVTKTHVIPTIFASCYKHEAHINKSNISPDENIAEKLYFPKGEDGVKQKYPDSSIRNKDAKSESDPLSIESVVDDDFAPELYFEKGEEKFKKQDGLKQKDSYSSMKTNGNDAESVSEFESDSVSIESHSWSPFDGDSELSNTDPDLDYQPKPTSLPKPIKSSGTKPKKDEKSPSRKSISEVCNGNLY